MKSIRRLLPLMLGIAVLAGCMAKRIIWSPDGLTGAVIGSKGLYLCDTNGVISELLVPEVVSAAWFPDSRRMALVISQEKNLLRIATNTDMKVTLGPVLAQETNEIHDITIAPTGAAIVYSCEQANKSVAALKVVLTDGSAAQVVSETASPYPDWTPDGKSLVYLTTTSTSTNDETAQLGLLMRRRLLDATNHIAIQEKGEELAGLAFGPTKVRCLKDGRIVFSSLELQLPSTQVDFAGRQQLFAVDPEKQATVIRLIPRTAEVELPEDLSSFEISPDNKQVSFLGEKGQVTILNLVKGDTTVIQPAAEFEASQPIVPVWRSNDSLCFQKLQKTNEVESVQIALWENGHVRVVSSTWPQEVRESLLAPKQK